MRRHPAEERAFGDWESDFDFEEEEPDDLLDVFWDLDVLTLFGGILSRYLCCT